MDYLILAFTAPVLGLTLFSVLYAAERLSARRRRKRMERRLVELTMTRQAPWNLNWYSRTYPNIPKRYKRKVR